MEKRRLGKTNLFVSHLALGTVELGYQYGIGPRNLPSEKEAIQLLRMAVDRGISFFDTAHFYGCAEERIAKSAIAQVPGIVIATKCGHGIEKDPNITANDLEKIILYEVEQSRKILGLEILDLVLVHGGSAEQIRSGIIIEIMQKLKDQQKIKHCGISTRGVKAPEAAIDSGFFEVLQVGYSIFDQRLRRSVLPKAKSQGIGIMARSVFLKGALTSANRFLPEELAELKRGYFEIEKIARKVCVDVPTLALCFALAEINIDSVLIGTNKRENLNQALNNYSDDLPFLPELLCELSKYAISDTAIVDPAYWPPIAVSDVRDGQKLDPHLYEKK